MVVIWEAICAFYRDRLASKKLDAIKAIGKKMGVTKEQILQYKLMIKEKEEMKKRQIKALFPNGYPILANEYNK